MKRRDFLTLQSSGSQRVTTLSCQRLFMAYSNLRSWPQQESCEMPANDEDWWRVEPPLSVAVKPVEKLFADLKDEVGKTDVLVLEDREWIQETEFSRLVEQLLVEFRASGGELRYAIPESEKATSSDSREAL